MADSLTQRRAEVTTKKNKERLIESISATSLNALEVDMEPLGVSVADKADLLTLICIAQGKDENLKKVLPNEKTENKTLKKRDNRGQWTGKGWQA